MLEPVIYLFTWEYALFIVHCMSQWKPTRNITLTTQQDKFQGRNECSIQVATSIALWTMGQKIGGSKQPRCKQIDFAVGGYV